MAEELQSLLERIQKDGVDKANAEAAEIVAKAKAEAASIVKKAKEEAAQAEAAAKTEAEASAKRAEETIRQAARDTILNVEAAVTKLLENLLAKDVEAALSTPAQVAPLALAAITVLGDPTAEVAANAPRAAALKSQLAGKAKSGIKIVTDESIQSGFSVRLDGGRVEHDFKGDAVVAALAKRLRPQLAALLK